jgi:hypothetical protein
MNQNQESLIKEVLKLMELSSMEDDEKNMWRMMVPSMNEEELTKFKAVLEKEVNKLTDIYLKVLKDKPNQSK